MAIDGLSTSFQGVEGHGEAQVFRPSRNVIGQFEGYMREASEDLKRRKEQAALDAANMGKVTADKIWEKDQDYFISSTNGLLKQTADFYKKYENNPKLVNSEQYYKDKMAISEKQNNINYEAQRSAQAKDLYQKVLDKINSDTDIYDNAHNTQTIAAILAEKDMGKRGEMLRTFNPKKNWDLQKSLKEAAEGIGSMTITDDNGVVKITTENERINPKTGKPTPYGIKEAQAIQMYLGSRDGIRSIEEVVETMGITGETPEEIEEKAGQIVAARIMAQIDQKRIKDVAPPRQPGAEEKKVQEAVTAGARKIGFSQAMLNSRGEQNALPISPEGDRLIPIKDDSGNVTQYKDEFGRIYNPNDVSFKNQTKKFDMTALDSKTWGTPVPTTYSAPFYVDMEGGGKTIKPSGQTDFLISSYDKLNYIEDNKGNYLLVPDESLNKPHLKEQFKKKMKQGWFALASIKATAGSDQVSNDMPKAIPLTKELYNLNKSKIKGADIPEDELWGAAKKAEAPAKTDKLQSYEVEKLDKKSGKIAIWDTRTNPPKFVRWQ